MVAPLAIEPELRAALAADLSTLAALHDQEPDRAILTELRQAPMADWLALILTTEPARTGLALIDRALAALPEPVDQPSLDRLAVDYADIYLTDAYRATPTESAWLDGAGPERQVCDVRRWYHRYGLTAADWRRRPEDHLVLQLRFLADLLARAPDAAPAALPDLARFLDRHILRWIGAFAGRVAGRCHMTFFAGLALLTAAYLDELRELLVEVTGEARPSSVSVQPEPTLPTRLLSAR